MKLNKQIKATMTLAALALAAGSAHAAVMIDFESYTVGNIHLQGPWVDFGGVLTSDVSTAQAFSGTQSLALSTTTDGAYGSDVYIENLDGAPITSGVWNLSFQVYVPNTYDGKVALYQSQGSIPTTAELGSLMELDNAAGAAVFKNGIDSTTLVFDQGPKLKQSSTWTQIRSTFRTVALRSILASGTSIILARQASVD